MKTLSLDNDARLVARARAMVTARKRWLDATKRIPAVAPEKLSQLSQAYQDTLTLLAWEAAYELIPDEIPATRAILDEQRAAPALAGVTL